MKRIIQFLGLVAIVNIHSFAQDIPSTIEAPSISAGAEFNLLLQEKIRLGEDADLRVENSSNPFQKMESPTLISTYEGINFDQNANITGYYQIPPDPIGAAGPNHLVSVVNSSIEWFTKAGVKQNSHRLGRNSSTVVGSFFEILGPISGTFDPKVIFDQYNGRFIVISLEQESTTSTSRILVAVSQTSNPNDGWYYHLINSAISVSGTTSWADYPGLAVGADAIYITANMFGFASGSYTGGRLWIIAKSPFYTGGAASVNIYDHITAASGFGSTYQPAHMFGTPQTNVGTFLILYSGLSGAGNEAVNVIRVDNPLSSPTFTGQNVSLGNVDNTNPNTYTNAPQLGTSTRIATNDRRSLNAVWRNNSLWSTFCLVPTSGADAGQVTAHWVRINTATLSSLSLLDQGNIGGESIATNCYTFFPSIAINSSNDACIGFAASASTIYPGAFFTGRLSTDPAGYTVTPDSVRRGRDFYVRTFGQGSNRWGDYSGSCVDPSNDQTFYVFNQYAQTRGSGTPPEDGRWGTAFGLVPVGALPVELSSFTAKVLKGGGIQLIWRTETEVSNYGFEVERLQDYNIEKLQDWNTIGFVEGNGNSNSPKNYSFTDEVPKYGNYAYRLKQIDTDGQFEYSNVIEVDAGDIPNGFVLEQNYPNPFNPATTIKFAVAETQKAELKVFDILGNEVATIFNGIADGGKIYEAVFNAENYSSGIYFYRLETENKVENRKMILIK